MDKQKSIDNRGKYNVSVAVHIAIVEVECKYVDIGVKLKSGVVDESKKDPRESL